MATGPARGGGGWVGVDTGGTFTDVVDAAGRIAKVPSTPDDPARGVRSAIEAVTAGAGRPTVLAHGTTVATNALLEGSGGTVCLIATSGFADIIEIGRQDRPSLYDPFVDRPPPLVDRERRFEVAGRLDATGAEIEPVDLDAVAAIGARLPKGAALAVSLLHSDLDPDHERAVARALADAGHDVSASHEVSPEFREVERTVTTVVNAALRPVCREYLNRLEGLADEVLVLTSAGGLVPVARGAEVPANLLLSGPAGGVAAAAAVAATCGHPDAVTLDMGGTSTDVCLVREGEPEPAGERVVGGYPVRLPSIDVHTIGAGGGSIAFLDAGGALGVGPRSAGAVPGPACYGRGGTEPTVTDADLMAGRLPAGIELPGIGRLDGQAAAEALSAKGIDGEGVIRVVEAAIQEAVRVVTVARGVDPRGLALVAFGGAGPVHACGVAEGLGMTTVIIPPRAGVLSAVGLLGAARQHDSVRSWPDPLDHHGLDVALADLAAAATAEVGEGSDVEVTTALDCRYRGQAHEIRVDTVDAFPAEHRARNGYDRPGSPVEVVALRATARRPSPVTLADLPAVDRWPARGPAVVAEPDCTVYVAPGWVAEPGPAGALVIHRESDG